MKILVLGSGFIGEPLALHLKADTTTLRLNELTEAILAPYDVVINAAARTNIDWCEKHREETFDTNVTQAVRIAKLVKGKYVFFSSGCIFKSEGPMDINYEDAIPNPQCFYTYTKLIAEQLLEETSPKTLIIRPRLLISKYSHPRNTINKLLGYSEVITSQESCTVLEDLMAKIKELLDKDAWGAFNIFNSGTVSPSQIMEVFQHPHRKITKRDLDELTLGKARRVSTVLGSKRTAPMPDIRERVLEIAKNWNK